MALIKCTECGTEVSDKAPACVKCGAPLALPQARTVVAAKKKGIAAARILMNILWGVIGVVVFASVVNHCSSSQQANNTSAASTSFPGPPERETTSASEQARPPTAATASAQDGLSLPQNNAVRSAKQYLKISGFSRDGLIQQLSASAGDGYDLADATKAVDSLDVDWNGEAVKSAKQYLRITGFSCSGLIQQLSSSAGDRYSLEQATYGAHHAGAC